MTTTSRFGRTRSGHSPIPGAIAIGVVLTGVVCGIAALTNHGAAAWQLPLILASSSLPILTTLGWGLLVDRRTLSGAIAHPEESVENRWYDRAAQGCFHDLLIVLGLGTTALSIIPAGRTLAATNVLLGVLVFIFLDVAIRYQVAKRQDA